MKMKRSSISSQLLILMLAALVLMVMMQVARAQVNQNQGNYQNQTSGQPQVMQISMPQKSLGKRLLENTSLTYYQQFLGPTAGGPGGQTYNVFQEATDSPGSGQAPIQSFHSVNLRHQINTNWAIGATLSAVNGYTDTVTAKDKNNFDVANNPDSQFFNARAYVSLPSAKFDSVSFFTTVAYEAPTSNISKENDMNWGWVVQETMAFNLPSYKWSAGVMGQIYRLYYSNNLQPATCEGCTPTALQTMIVSGGPYLGYRFNDYWMLNSLLTFDWDQRGRQTGTRDFNNNLSDRGRLTLSYFPQKLKFIQSVGLFAQALIKYRPDTTAIGADFAIRF